MKNLAIIGSTGSIGTQALSVIRRHRDKFCIKALCAHSNINLLMAQIEEFSPDYVGLTDYDSYKKIQQLYPRLKVLFGDEALALGADKEIDTAIISIVGMTALKSVIYCLKSGKTVALANKESIVSAGKIIKDLETEFGGKIIPVDSEHSAIWQCLMCAHKKDVKRIILTASGGPFKNYSLDMLKSVTPEQAVKHPNWKMGKKISVDSATMINKALEIIEARWLFDTTDIDYIIHPQSVVHSMVEFMDGCVMAQMSSPDMQLPIQLALTFPDRLPSEIKPFSFTTNITFVKPDEAAFPAPRLAYKCLQEGGNYGCVLSAGDEAAVQLFLDKRIAFTDIYKICENALAEAHFIDNPSLEDIYLTYEETYQRIINNYKNKRI